MVGVPDVQAGIHGVEMQRGLAEARWAKVRGREQEDGEWQMAVIMMARALCDQGRYREAETKQREVLAAQQRKLGADHPDTLVTAGDLATTLAYQGKHAEAEKIEREVLVAEQRKLGADHPNTLTTAGNLASTLAAQGKHAEADKMERSAR